jgi:hypothetical protein
MPTHVSWFIENRLIEVKFTGDITAEDLEHGAKQVAVLLNQTTHAPVHVLHDYGAMTDFPRNLNLVRVVSKVSLSHPRRGWIVAHSIQQSLARFIATGAAHLSKAKIHILDTREQALTFLKRIDPALQESDML